MSAEENKAIVRRYFEGDRDGRDNIAVWDEVCDPNIVVFLSILPEPVRGLAPLKQFSAATHNAFADFGIKVEDMVVEGDRVAARWTMRGTHSAPLALPSGTLPPTGRTLAVAGISLCRLASGKINEERVEADWVGMLQQLGVIPAPDARGA